MNDLCVEVLKANFYLTCTQLAGLHADSEFAVICRSLLGIVLRREGREQTIVRARLQHVFSGWL